MTDIVERLRELEQVEHELAHDCDYPPEATANWKYAETCREAAAEIARLRAGGCARDQGTTQYCAEAARLAAENERLREWNAEIALNARHFAEALREIAKVTYGWEPGVWSEEEGRKYFASLFFDAQAKARAALEGK